MKRPNRGHVREAAYIAIFAALTVICTWIAVPTSPPFTMQSFAVLTAGLCLGARRGTAAVAVWLALGAVGAPVFTGFGGGIGHLAGITGGYALGFLGTAWMAGMSASRGRGAQILGCAAGMLVCYAVGTAWYVIGYSRGAAGIGQAVTLCVLPFLLPDAGKIALALAMSRILRRHVRL